MALCFIKREFHVKYLCERNSSRRDKLGILDYQKLTSIIK